MLYDLYVNMHSLKAYYFFLVWEQLKCYTANEVKENNLIKINITLHLFF